MRVFITISCLFTWLLIASCDDGELNPLVSSDGESDTDTDTDTDTDSGGDTDTDTELTCPVNSGYPCACNAPLKKCIDNSDCIVRPGDTLGMCLPECGPSAPFTNCGATNGWGVISQPEPGWCGFNSEDPQSDQHYDHCILVCEINGEEGPCPPYLDCIAHPALVLPPQYVCLPTY